MDPAPGGFRPAEQERGKRGGGGGRTRQILGRRTGGCGRCWIIAKGTERRERQSWRKRGFDIASSRKGKRRTPEKGKVVARVDTNRIDRARELFRFTTIFGKCSVPKWERLEVEVPLFFRTGEVPLGRRRDRLCFRFCPTTIQFDSIAERSAPARDAKLGRCTTGFW